MDIPRRNVLLGGLVLVGAGALVVPLGSAGAKSASRLKSSDMPRPYAVAFERVPLLEPTSTSVDPADGKTVAHYTINQMVGEASMLPRLKTKILGYNGIFPGPTISVDQGTKVVLKVRNRLPATHPMDGNLLATSVHLHGSASLPQYDGYANDVTHTGFAKDYHYPNFQPGRTLWYHDHGVHHTALSVYAGLAGQYHLHDPRERRVLPQGEFDVALTVSDAMFAANGSLAYDDNNDSGLWGDVVLVNGKPWPVMKVKKRIYRFRILNASISRSYRPTLSTRDQVVVVATDGGLMPRPHAAANWRHAAAERYEVLIDFSKYKTGQRVELRNLSNKNNVDYDHTNKIMAFDVVDDAFDHSDPTWDTFPTELDSGNEVMALKESQAVKKRSMRVKRDDATNMWTIDDTSWGDIVASNFQDVFADVELGATEVWEIENKSGGWFHPMHIHLIDFKVLSRNGRAPFPYELGPKDVVYVGEDEKVRVLMRFGPHKGRYMVHCHNLPHEDHDMMTQFRVGLKRNEYDVNDPIEAARPVWDG